MTLSIVLSPELELELRRRAAASGKGVAALVIEAVEEKLRAPETLAELLAPIHATTRQTGMTEEEIDSLIEEARNEVFAAKRGGEQP